MGRHSAPDDDEEPEGTVALIDDLADDPAARLAAERRGRHYRGEDVESTGPVPGAAVRRDEERAAVQDERPTERLDLAAIEGAVAAEAFATEPPATEPPATEPPATEPPATAGEPPPAAEPGTPKAKAPKRGRAAQSTAADLALIRRHADVRNRVLGAAVVPFVLYAAVLLVLSATAVRYLLWIWIPTVTAGVLIGFALDAGHKRHDEPAEPEDGPS